MAAVLSGTTTNYNRTLSRLQSLQHLLKCKKCQEETKCLYSLGGCEHMFCRSCCDVLLGKDCPVCFLPADVRDATVNRPLSNVAGLCQELFRMMSDQHVLSDVNNISDKRENLQDELESTPQTNITTQELSSPYTNIINSKTDNSLILQNVDQTERVKKAVVLPANTSPRVGLSGNKRSVRKSGVNHKQFKNPLKTVHADVRHDKAPEETKIGSKNVRLTGKKVLTKSLENVDDDVDDDDDVDNEATNFQSCNKINGRKIRKKNIADDDDDDDDDGKIGDVKSSWTARKNKINDDDDDDDDDDEGDDNNDDDVKCKVNKQKDNKRKTNRKELSHSDEDDDGDDDLSSVNEETKITRGQKQKPKVGKKDKKSKNGLIKLRKTRRNDNEGEDDDDEDDEDDDDDKEREIRKGREGKEKLEVDPGIQTTMTQFFDCADDDDNDDDDDDNDDDYDEGDDDDAVIVRVENGKSGTRRSRRNATRKKNTEKIESSPVQTLNSSRIKDKTKATPETKKLSSRTRNSTKPSLALSPAVIPITPVNRSAKKRGARMPNTPGNTSSEKNGTEIPKTPGNISGEKNRTKILKTPVSASGKKIGSKLAKTPKDEGVKTPQTPKYRTPQSASKAGNRSSEKSGKLVKRNARGETPLHVAAIKGDYKTAEELVKNGAGVNSRDNAGWTPLHEAVNHGHVKIAELLLDHGAMINTPGLDNDTPLHDAINNNRVDCVRLLVARGASLTIRNIHGLSAKDIAVTEPIVDALQEPVASQLPSTSDQAQMIEEEDYSMLCFLATALSRDERIQLQKCANMLHATVVEDFCPEVTHVITSCNKNGACPRTIKYLQGILSGVWIVNMTWIKTCQEYGCKVCEEIFEIPGSSTNPDSRAPHKGRLNRKQQLPGLFDGCQFYFHGIFEYPTPEKEQLMELVKAGGGKILSREPKLQNLDEYPATVPYHAESSSRFRDCSIFIVHDTNWAYPAIHATRMCAVPASWLLESIGSFSFSPLH